MDKKERRNSPVTLPFDNDNKRKWQCFCCGIFFNNENEFVEHIIKEHDESRDYVKCPHCKSPVRDIRLHWNAKHACLPFPKNCQIRATIWKDFSGKKIKTKKPKFKQGFFDSKKMRKAIFYRSGYELSVYECLEYLNEVVNYDAECLKIPYFWQGEPRTYVPDIYIEFLDGRREIWEVKPEKQTCMEQNKAKWEAVQIYCKHRGWNFKVIKEREIKELKKKCNIS